MKKREVKLLQKQEQKVRRAVEQKGSHNSDDEESKGGLKTDKIAAQEEDSWDASSQNDEKQKQSEKA